MADGVGDGRTLALAGFGDAFALGLVRGIGVTLGISFGVGVGDLRLEFRLVARL